MCQGFPGGSDSKDSACNAGVLNLIPESGRSPGKGNGYPPQYSCLENPMDRWAWQATVHGGHKKLDMTEWLTLSLFTLACFRLCARQWAKLNTETDLCHSGFTNSTLLISAASMEVGCGRDKRLGREWDQRHVDKTSDNRILGAVGKPWFVVTVQSLSRVQFFAIPWTAACQTPLSFTISWNLLRFMSIESVMLSNHLILCYPLLLLPSIFPNIRVFSSESSLCQNVGASASASASVLPMNI